MQPKLEPAFDSGIDSMPASLESPSTADAQCTESMVTESTGVSTDGTATESTHVSSDDSDDTPLAARFAKRPKRRRISSDSGDEAERLSSPPPKKEPSNSSDDDIPLAKRVDFKRRSTDTSNDVKPDVKSERSPSPKRKVAKSRKTMPPKATKKKAPKVVKSDSGDVKTKTAKELKKEREAEEDAKKWRWWEEKRRDDGTKWHFLEHAGPMLAPPYERLPDHVHLLYKGKPLPLSEASEEVATFYGRMIDHDYTKKAAFNNNFFRDWRAVMTSEERTAVVDLERCDFTVIDAHFKKMTVERKERSKEEKLKSKKEREKEQDTYGTAILDGYEQKLANFRIEPPGLFRGRGDHPKMGTLKKRIVPEDIIINCSKKSKAPKPPAGHRWKEVRHDDRVAWLVNWTENVLGANKYVLFQASAKLKGEKDMDKFDMARRLHANVDTIRGRYTVDMKSKEMRIRQRAVALYFIDKLALRAGNEKETEELADTVGCCSLRVEHITLHEKLNGERHVVEFDFLGKDCIRYQNEVPVDKRVFKNVKLFMVDKIGGDDLFDRLTTSMLNKHLTDEMAGLTAKVFRTYNASITLHRQLEELSDASTTVHERLLSYNRANRAVAILCNHQRAVPKTFEKSMENMKVKEGEIKEEIKRLKKEVKGQKGEKLVKMHKRIETKKEQLARLCTQMTDKDENKQIALSTSKLNYLDPRISVAWCKKYDVPIEKIYNKTQRDKFQWAIDMTEEGWAFDDLSTIRQ